MNKNKVDKNKIKKNKFNKNKIIKKKIDKNKIDKLYNCKTPNHSIISLIIHLLNINNQ